MMKYKNILLSGILFLLYTIVGAQSARTYYQDEGLVPRPHPVDFTHLNLNIAIEPEQQLVKGTVREDFTVLQQGVDTLFLDAIKMRFSSVKLDGKIVEYTTSNTGITLRFKQELAWGSKHSIELVYEANPSKGIYFIGWDDETGRARKQIWTQGQGIDNRHWIPMYDERNDKLITEITLEFDEKFQVLSNGEKLKEKKLGNGRKLWHYKISHPHAPYLIMLGIGEYAIKSEKSSSGVPMNFYYYPDQPEQLEPTYLYSKEMFDFFEKEIGVAYPWSVYSQIPVQDFMYGAMENTTATIYGDFYLVDKRGFLDKNYVRVNAHELAHQWFGDMITARSSSDHWLQESFATHYDLVYQGEAFGEDHYNWTRRNYNEQALNASKKDLKPIAHSGAGTVRHYPKGALVLQMLKYVVGREQFNATIKYYLEKHAYESVNSIDLLAAFHERLGMSLNWFWEDWVYRGGEPHYEVMFESNAETATFWVEQVHEQNDFVDLFRMPIVMSVFYKDGTAQSKRVWIEKQSHKIDFQLTAGKEVDYVLFDPNSEILKEVSFPKSTEMLRAQAAKAEHMIDRYDALVALGAHDFPGKEAFLKERFEKEQFYAPKEEIVKQLAGRMDEVSSELLTLALKDSSVELRKAALANTFRIPEELEGNYRNLLSDPSYEVIEEALGLLAFYRSENIDDYLELTRKEEGNRSKNVRILWLQLAYQYTKDEAYLKELIDYTSNSFEFLTRIKAARALEELNELNENALANLLEGVFSFNNRLRGQMNRTIRHFYAQQKYKKMIVAYVAEQEWNNEEFRKVKRYLFY
jgi:aminopeptidase N